MAFSLPELPYPYEALEPYMSKETLQYHHDKHHMAYVTNGNNLLKDSGLDGLSLTKIVKASYGKYLDQIMWSIVARDWYQARAEWDRPVN